MRRRLSFHLHLGAIVEGKLGGEVWIELGREWIDRIVVVVDERKERVCHGAL